MMDDRLIQELIDAMGEIEIIDAHEHLPPERERLKLRVDICFLFSHYTRSDLISAGMPPTKYDEMLNPDLPLEERFLILEPFLPYIRYGSYARAAFIALRDIYGYDEITRQNYKEISEKMASFNKPGIYEEILVKRCRAKYALTQAGRTDYPEPFLVPILPLEFVAFVNSREEIEKRSEALAMPIKTLDDYIAWIGERLSKWRKEERVVGLKTRAEPRKEPPPTKQRAEEAFRAIMDGKATDEDKRDLYLFLTEETFKLCANLNMVVAVHAGVWGDFRTLDPRLMIPLFARHPETKFDLYHMGMPWVRDTAFIGKNFQNVYLNLCWSHIVSPTMVRHSLPEYIDIVPVNKIIAFGGDYSAPAVEKVWGHLVMARENIAYALAILISDGRMGKEEALELAKLWFYENPAMLYGLK
jgi:predicted TIM-barrel fold metal-dependent hydrolase